MTENTHQIYCQKSVIDYAGKTHPIYVGFSTAAQLHKIASAPSFSASTDDVDICANVADPPVKKWQRPLIDDKVRKIKQRFTTENQIMPNPVLLAANPHLQNQVRVEREELSGGGLSKTHIVTIKEPAEDAETPLWILDGQHRIAGLASSALKNEPLPLVLLRKEGDSGYTDAGYAEIFAQVTTEATSLDPMHEEWMRYAFELGEYGEEPHRHAMRATIELCRNQTTECGQPNPFHNKIAFNPEKKPLTRGPDPAGFAWSCIKWKELFHNHYFSQSCAHGTEKTPRQVADQIALAYTALKGCMVGDIDKSVFFSTNSNKNTIVIQQAFVVGVLARIHASGPPPSWKEFLKQLRFDADIWDFNWVVSLQGRPGTASRNIATAAFRVAFETGEVPGERENLAEFLQGGGAFVSFTTGYLTRSGKSMKQQDRVTWKITDGPQTIDLGNRDMIKIITSNGDEPHKSTNIDQIQIVDKEAPTKGQWEFKVFKKGIKPREHAGESVDSANLEIAVELFGGRFKHWEIFVKWNRE